MKALQTICEGILDNPTPSIDAWVDLLEICKKLVDTGHFDNKYKGWLLYSQQGPHFDDALKIIKKTKAVRFKKQDFLLRKTCVFVTIGHGWSSVQFYNGEKEYEVWGQKCPGVNFSNEYVEPTLRDAYGFLQGRGGMGFKRFAYECPSEVIDLAVQMCQQKHP